MTVEVATAAMAETIERIVLVGLSGAGKTTVGRRLAELTGWVLADSDDWIVAATGRSIADLFANDGEPRFRQLEHQAIAALCQHPRLILSTGGGVVTRPENWPLLRRSSRVVWLQVRPETVVARLLVQQAEGAAAVRPLLAGAEPLTRVQAMAAARHALYAQADLMVVADDRPPTVVAEAVLTAIAASGARLTTAVAAAEEERR
jgi:shikimate kinase